MCWAAQASSSPPPPIGGCSMSSAAATRASSYTRCSSSGWRWRPSPPSAASPCSALSLPSLAWRPRAPRTVGWKLLRGLAFAGLVPLLALGAVASFLAQRAIEEQVREDTVRTAAVEADFLRRYVEDARESLRMLLDSPGFRG